MGPAKMSRVALGLPYSSAWQTVPQDLLARPDHVQIVGNYPDCSLNNQYVRQAAFGPWATVPMLGTLTMCT